MSADTVVNKCKCIGCNEPSCKICEDCLNNKLCILNICFYQNMKIQKKKTQIWECSVCFNSYKKEETFINHQKKSKHYQQQNTNPIMIPTFEDLYFNDKKIPRYMKKKVKVYKK